MKKKNISSYDFTNSNEPILQKFIKFYEGILKKKNKNTFNLKFYKNKFKILK